MVLPLETGPDGSQFLGRIFQGGRCPVANKGLNEERIGFALRHAQGGRREPGFAGSSSSDQEA